MTTKTTGAEFKRFYNDNTFWPQDKGNTYHEDEEITVNGVFGWEDDYGDIPDDAVVAIAGGMVRGPQWNGNEPSFEAYFKRWRKKQNTTSFAVEAPNDKIDAIKAAIKAAGGKIA